MTGTEDRAHVRFADADGIVSVTMSAEGRPTRIVIAPAGYRLGAAELSARITATCRLAAAKALGARRSDLAGAGVDTAVLDRARLPRRADLIAAERAADDGAPITALWRAGR